MTLSTWEARPVEEANLFNPAFCGALIIEFVKEYAKAKQSPVPIILPFCALPISLHPRTRAALPSTTVNSMYTWLERNQKLLVGYPARAKSLVPAVQEAMRFILDREAISVTDGGELSLGEGKTGYTAASSQMLTNDARECVSATRFLGRWFARAGTPSTIMSGWGIRP